VLRRRYLRGQVTQAVYIFTNMLIKLLREEKPDYIAAILNRKKTFRHETFADYKANRQEMQRSGYQLPYIFRLRGIQHSSNQCSG
jgi:DNA polymerase-1